VRVTAVRGLENVIAGDTRISTVDGAAGSLTYSGYEIRELAAHASFAEAVYLLWHGELPTEAELDAFRSRLVAEMRLPSQVIEMIKLALPSAHPMDLLRTAVSALAMYDPRRRGSLPGGVRAQVRPPPRPDDHDRRRHASDPPWAPGSLRRSKDELRRELPVHAPRPGARRRGASGVRPAAAPPRARVQRVDLRDPRHGEHAVEHARRADQRPRRVEGEAARRRQRTGDRHLRSDRRRRHDRGLHRRDAQRREADHGLRAPRLQGGGPAGAAPEEPRPDAVPSR